MDTITTIPPSGTKELVAPNVYKLNLGVGTDGTTPSYKYVDSTGANVNYTPTITATPSGTSALTSTGLQGTVYSSSAPVVAQENNAASTVAGLNTTDVQAASDKYMAELQRQNDALDARRAADEAAINSSFDVARKKQDIAQTHETGTFTSTLARIGGYLGDSASAQGALVNLNQQHQFEISDLEAKRASALQEAKNAVDEKQSALAIKKAQEYKDLSKEIQDRKEKFFTQSMQIVKAEQDKQAEERLKRSAEITDATKIADNTASTLSDYFTANPNLTPEQKDNAIIEVAKAKGIDPIYVAQSLADYRRVLASADPATVQEYNFVKSQGQFSGTLLQYIASKRDAMRVATTGGNTFTKDEAVRYDLPKELIGKSEADVISDLNVSRVPDWFRLSQVRAGNIAKDATDAEFKAQWENFRNLPDIQIYRKTMDLNKVDSKSGNVAPEDTTPLF